MRRKSVEAAVVGTVLSVAGHVAAQTPWELTPVTFEVENWSFRAAFIPGGGPASRVIGIRSGLATDNEFNVVIYSRATASSEWTAEAWNGGALSVFEHSMDGGELDSNVAQWMNEVAAIELSQPSVPLEGIDYRGGLSASDGLAAQIDISGIRDELIAVLVDVGYPAADVPFERQIWTSVVAPRVMLNAIAESSAVYVHAPESADAAALFFESVENEAPGATTTVASGVEIIYPRPDTPTSTPPAWSPDGCISSVPLDGPWGNCCTWTRGPYIVTRYRTRARVNPTTNNYQYCDQTQSCSRTDTIKCCTGGPFGTQPVSFPPQPAEPDCSLNKMSAEYAQCSAWTPACPF